MKALHSVNKRTTLSNELRLVRKCERIWLDILVFQLFFNTFTMLSIKICFLRGGKRLFCKKLQGTFISIDRFKFCEKSLKSTKTVRNNKKFTIFYCCANKVFRSVVYFYSYHLEESESANHWPGDQKLNTCLPGCRTFPCNRILLSCWPTSECL